jgi:phage gp36-like protein
MTTYASLQDMIDSFTEHELVELTNLSDPAATTVNDNVIEQALEDATAQINAYVAVRYTLPLPSVPKSLRRACVDIARYLLDNDRTREDVLTRYRDVIKFLQVLSKGLAVLVFDDLGVPEVSTETDAPRFTRVDPIFSRDTLCDY